MILRSRRFRQNKVIRDLTVETRLSVDMLVYPVFIREGHGIVENIPSLPGQKRCSPDTFPRALGAMQAAGVSSVLLFGLSEHKDERARARGTRTASFSSRCA